MIFLQTLSKGVINLDVDPSNHVYQLKKRIEESNLAPVSCQKLIFNGRTLNDNSLLSGVSEGALVSLVLDLEGGAKKRKKKTYATPKKVKHKHKNVKLAILKLFSIENDKVKALRRECSAGPAEGCRRGPFLAKRSDREYCGYCKTTFVYSQKGATAA